MTNEKKCALAREATGGNAYCPYSCKEASHAAFSLLQSRIPGTDTGNIHISPTSGLISRFVTMIGGEACTQKSERQGELDGMEYIAHCTPIYALVQQLNTPPADDAPQA